MVLTDGTPAYKVWKKSETPTLLKIYLFDVMNPDSVVKNAAKPLLNEKGPYVFQ